MSTSHIRLLFIVLIALSSRCALGFTGSQCSHQIHHFRGIYSKRSVSSSNSFSVTTLSQPREYANSYQDKIQTMVRTETVGREVNLLSRIPSQLSNLLSFDKSKAASMGVAFAMTYNFISNINGSITLSTAWYIASSRTGLSPLAAGQWKSLMSAYGSLYLFVTLMRPLRFGMALSLTKHTERLIAETQSRIGCSRPVAIGLDVATGIAIWVGSMAGGVMSASALSGVPVF